MAHNVGNRRFAGDVDKPKNFKKSIAKLLRYSKKHLPMIIIALLITTLAVVIRVYSPTKLQELSNAIIDGFNRLSQTGMWFLDLNAITNICVVILVLCVLNFIFNFVQGLIMANVTQKVTKNLRRDISVKINKLPLKYIDGTATGDILSRVTNDVDLIGQSLNNSIVTIVSSVFLFFGTLIMMFIKNWLMAITAILATILGFVIMILVMKNSQKYFIKQQKNMGELNGFIEEVYSGHKIIKAYNAESESKAKFNVINKRLYNSGWKSQFYSGLIGPLMGFIGNLGFVAVCVVGALLYSSGKVDFGAITAFMIYVNLFSNSLSQMAQVTSSIQSAAASSERIFEFLDEEELSYEGNKKEVLSLNEISGNVSFRNVRFGYVPGKTVIKNFSVDIKAGQKVAIVGPTGAGKTTIVNILMRFYELNQPRLILGGKLTDYKVFDNGKSVLLDVSTKGYLIVNNQETDFLVPDNNLQLFKNGAIKFDQDFNIYSNKVLQTERLQIITGNEIETPENYEFAIAYYGDIFIDGKPINSLTRNNIHDMFSMVLQDTWLFEGTVRENVVYSKQNVDDDEVINACKCCGIDHIIKTLPNGYNTILSDKTNISAGQRQLLTIARAMVQNSPMLILDEATSSVDTRTEQLIQKSMDSLTKNRTSFVIAHRLSTIKNADQIIVVKDGDIVECGNHNELIAKNGFYSVLYNSQFQEV